MPKIRICYECEYSFEVIHRKKKTTFQTARRSSLTQKMAKKESEVLVQTPLNQLCSIAFLLQLIFSRSGYQKGLLVFCDICYKIINAAKKSYYQCQNCDDFVACHHCVKNNRDSNHSAHHSFRLDSGLPHDSWIHMNLGITCDICLRESFYEERYQCQTCLPLVSFDACSSCLP